MVKKAKRAASTGYHRDFGLLGLILFTAGFYFVVWGFIIQTTNLISWSMWNWNAALLYLIGFFLFGLGKKYKHRNM